MSSVFSMEDDGISNACTMKVIMNNPVTSTPASDARNSTVVSRGFSLCCFSFCAKLPSSFENLVHQPQRAIPARDLENVAHGIQEPVKFITGGWGPGIGVGSLHRPINKERPAHDVFPGHESPVATVGTVVAIVAHHEVVSFRHDQLIVHH